MLTQFRVDCIYPAHLGSLSLRGVARISENLMTYYQPPDGRRCRLYPFSSTAISETLAGKREGMPTFIWVASYVLSYLRHAVGQRLGRRDQGTTVLPYWENIYAAHVADAAVEATKGRARKLAILKEVADSAARRMAYKLPQDQQDFLLTHGPYGKTLIARAQLGHPHARYRVALLMATDPALADDATALLIDVASTGHPLALDLLDAAHEAPALAGADPDVACPVSQVAAQFAWDLGRVARDHGAHEHAYAFFRAAARGDIPEAVLEVTQMQIGKTDPEAAEWLSQLRAKAPIGRHRRDEAENGTAPRPSRWAGQVELT